MGGDGTANDALEEERCQELEPMAASWCEKSETCGVFLEECEGLIISPLSVNSFPGGAEADVGFAGATRLPGLNCIHSRADGYSRCIQTRSVCPSETCGFQARRACGLGVPAINVSWDVILPLSFIELLR
jgi:hypothetical protein